jgi:hypothetical protein
MYNVMYIFEKRSNGNMGRMIRKQIYIDSQQDKALKRQAQDLGVSVAELIRRRISRAPHEEPQFDQQSWEEMKQFMYERSKMKVPQTGRQWTRDELYEEDD